MFTPRPRQAEVLAYAGGRMGVSAVPGSGKTHVLSALAARLVAEADLAEDQEVLVVTLVNSAVDNFSQRVDEFVQAAGLLPHVGYRVRTLHGLAHDIVRERPALVGLADDFQILDERETNQILQEAAEAWIARHPEAAGPFLDPELDARKADWVRREQWPKLVSDLAKAFIRLAKDLELTPAQLREQMHALGGAESAEAWPLLDMGVEIYADYQHALAYRGAVDYDDLIRLALLALRSDGEYLRRLQHRWPFILEDEAQDSSQLQEQILRLLAAPIGDAGSGERRGWVRVGDPNQAIYETFTTASPRFLRDFLTEEGVIARELPNSGRSTQSIMDLANYLVDWSRDRHPIPALRDALAPTHIEPTPPGDPQPNPPDDPAAVALSARRFTVDEELCAVVESLGRWVPQNQDKTVAVLVPRNDRGEAVENALKAAGLESVALLRSTRATREVAGALGNVTADQADPGSPKRLATLYAVWRRADRDDPDERLSLEACARALRRCQLVEDFLWPRAGRQSLDALMLPEGSSVLSERLLDFRDLVRRWQGATILPIDQLILTIAADIFDRPADLAVAHKLAILLKGAAESHPDWRLAELTQELAVIARNERKFLGFSGDDTGFDPEKHKGKVVVATIHKAKGLEWDRVHLMSVNAYDFPSAGPGDSFIAERWWVAGQINLEANALAQLHSLHAGDLAALSEPPGAATLQARLEYAAERLRLLYVGITRAKRDLIITYNTGRRPGPALQPAAPLLALQAWWDERNPPKI